MTVEELYKSVERLRDEDKDALLKAVVFALWGEIGESDEDETVNPDKEWDSETVAEIADQVLSRGVCPTRE